MGRRSTRLLKAEAETETKDVTRKSKKLKGVDKEKNRKHKKHKKNKENRAKAEGAPATDEVEVKEVKAFQRKREDGTTSLAILTAGEEGGEERTVTLGMLLGRIKAGTSSLATFREDRRNVAKPMLPIYYGGYSSHGPTHDSTFANMTKEESAIVGPYFDKRTLENEGVIRAVMGDDYSSTFVDHLLDLFNGKEVKDIVANNSKATEKKVEKDAKTMEEIDFDLLKTLEQDGIDVSFMSQLQAAYELRQEQEMEGLSLEQQLELTAHLIDTLASAQSARLSAPPPPSLGAIPGPGAREARLADRVVTNLAALAGAARPQEVVNLPEVRRAMGVAAPPPGPLVVGGVVAGEVAAPLTNGLTNGVAEEEVKVVTNGVSSHEEMEA